MIKVIRSSPLVVIFWIICLTSIVIVWRLMPTVASQAALVVLLVTVIFSTLLYQTELPILTTVFLSILVIQYWLVTSPQYQILFIALSAFLVPAIGLAGDRINRDFRQMEKDQVLSHWLLLGLMTGESVSIFNNWPVSFFNRSLLTAIIFYTFWHLLRVQHNLDQRRSYIAHFVFVGVAVIVVIGIIIWANFPHLIN